MADTTIETPVMFVDRNRLFTVWNLTDIFLPSGKGGRYVPNINDEVREWGTNGNLIAYRVRDVDYTTGRSDLELVHDQPYSEDLSISDIVLGITPGRPSASFRAYVDKSVKPATLSLDTNLIFPGSLAKSIKLFLGTDISAGSGQVVSVMYDQSGNLLGENIPLETVATARLPNRDVPQGWNQTLKIAQGGYTNYDLPDNQVLTYVAYADDGGVVQTGTVLVMNTAFARQPDAFKKYIVKDGISIKSPFISDGDSQLLEFPLNMSLESLVAWGEVTYSDGSVKELPIDGTKFRIHGLYANRYLATSAGQRVPLVLTYVLDEEEAFYGENTGALKHISVPYSAVTLPMDNAYSIKIFTFPEWLGPAQGYRLRHFLYTLNRNRVYDVTNLVRLAINSAAFEPTLYGQVQHLILTCDMNKVDGSFNSYRFVQPISVTLREDGTDASDTWTVNLNPEDSVQYGVGIKAIGDYQYAGRIDLDLSQGCKSLEDWLNRMFYALDPLRNPSTELQAPAPTHFNLVVGAKRTEYSVSMWNKTVPLLAVVNPGELLFLEWIHRDGNGDKLLATSGVAYYQTA